MVEGHCFTLLWLDNKWFMLVVLCCMLSQKHFQTEIITRSSMICPLVGAQQVVTGQALIFSGSTLHLFFSVASFRNHLILLWTSYILNTVDFPHTVFF